MYGVIQFPAFTGFYYGPCSEEDLITVMFKCHSKSG
jgi:hypothetical protein